MTAQLTRAELQAALDSDGPNEPAAIEGLRGTNGTRLAPTSPEDARKRREIVGQLLAMGVSRDKITDICIEKLKLTEGSVGAVIADVRAEWAEEDKERGKHARAESIRRIKGHIIKASDKAQFSAIAQLEKTLADIEGTVLETAQDHGDNMAADAILAVLSELKLDNPKEFRLLVETERIRVALELKVG